LHDIVLAIEKVCGITFIERKRLESSKRFKQAGGPLPPVREKTLNAKGASALRKCIDGKWIPAFEIEVSVQRRWLLSAPGKASIGTGFGTELGTACRAMPLRLRRQPFPGPCRVRGRLRVADVNRPIQRQRDFVEHGPIPPTGSIGNPERRMRHA